MMARLALGTVQFGLRYGVANQSGQVDADEAGAILSSARAGGVDMLDTAIAYGESEAVLGAAGVRGWQVVTKLPACPEDCTDVAAWVCAEIEASRRRLGVTSFYGVLLHRPAQLLEAMGPALYRALQRLKEEGIAERTGVSIYAPDELEVLVPRFALDLVQLPLNILDGRWAANGWLARLNGQGTEIHARSAFLQGLLLMPAQRRPPFFAHWRSLWQAWDGWLASTGLTPLQASLRHALAVPEIARVVVGADSLAQWRDILAAAQGPAPSVPAGLATQDATLLNPACWKL